MGASERAGGVSTSELNRRLLCSLKQGCDDRHARGRSRGELSIVNFATGLLEVHKDSTHLTVGPSHGLTARRWPVRTRSVPKRVVPSRCGPLASSKRERRHCHGVAQAKTRAYICAHCVTAKILFRGRNKSWFAAFLNCLLSSGPAARRTKSGRDQDRRRAVPASQVRPF